jgi:diguanylate cyclase (GGDEF)-like protein/PAS domain S-box-containing protein
MPHTLSREEIAFDRATAAVLERQRATAARITNIVRLTLLGLLGLAAILIAPRLPPLLDQTNTVVIGSLLCWSLGQHVAVHLTARSWAQLSTINAYVDISAVSVLLLAYGVLHPTSVSITTPLYATYFVILATRPFAGSSGRAALASIAAVLQYGVVAALVLVSKGALVPADLSHSFSVSAVPLLEEATKLALLAVAGVVMTGATAWNEKTLRRTIRSARASEARFASVFEQSAVGILLLDESYRIINSNAAFDRFLGLEAHQLRGHAMTDFLPPEHADSASRLMGDVASGVRSPAHAEVRFVRADGQVVWGAVSVSRTEESGEARLITVVQNVSERKKLEAELFHQAFHDPLTELANRSLFRNSVEHALARTARQAERVAVLFLDVDDFKSVNDTQGHAAGDRLLQAVGARLLSATRGCDTVARLGGDEFAALLEGMDASEGATTVAERVVASLRHPVDIGDGRTASISASIGIAVAGGSEGTDDLLRNADVAMYHAKQHARGAWVMYHPTMHAKLLDRVTLESDLRRAIDGGELTLAYQPFVDVTSRQIRGFEALLRWSHAGRGSVIPEVFVAVAEESGLILTIGPWALRDACRQAAAWNHGRDESPFTITVNLSGKQLEDEALPGHVAAALDESGLAPGCLVLEITESVIMRDTPTMLWRLNQLKRLGVRLAIDDFGTGYSSLSYLQQFPVDILKIDRSFIDGLHRGANDAALVRTIVTLAKTLALVTIAEGVEDRRQYRRLRELGCDFAQGFLFSEPLDAEAVVALLGADTGTPRLAPVAAHP